MTHLYIHSQYNMSLTLGNIPDYTLKYIENYTRVVDIIAWRVINVIDIESSCDTLIRSVLILGGIYPTKCVRLEENRKLYLNKLFEWR